MRKQDRQGIRSPAEVDRRYALGKIRGDANEARKTASDAQETAKRAQAQVSMIADNGTVKGSVIVEAINNQSTVKIAADKLDIQGKKLDIKVESTNIEGKMTAKQINADGIVAKDVDITGKVTAPEGQIGGWTLGIEKIPISPNENIEESALTSPLLTDTVNGRTYSYKVYLTPQGVYVGGQYSTSNEVGISYYANKTWLEILGEQI